MNINENYCILAVPDEYRNENEEQYQVFSVQEGNRLTYVMGYSELESVYQAKKIKCPCKFSTEYFQV